MSTIKARILSAFVLPALVCSLMVPSLARAQEETAVGVEKSGKVEGEDKTDKVNPGIVKNKSGKVDPGTSVPVKKAPARPSGAARIGNGQVAQANFVVPNRYVFVALAWVNEPYWINRAIRNPQTGRVIVVPVVYYQRRLVQVYLDQVTNVYFYFDSFGNPVPYVRSPW